MESKMGDCIMCNKPGKYRCPGCEKVSCSAACSRKHKEDNNCTGIRDRLAFVDKKDMDNLTLLSDYRFLEEIDHRLDDGLRNPLRRSIVPSAAGLELPGHLKKLKFEARQRGTTLEFMPQPFSKHSSNTSRFDFAKRVIRWHIEWVFFHADINFTDESVHEDTKLDTLLRRYMEPLDRLDFKDPHEINNPISTEDSEKLSYYHSASYNRIAVLLKTQNCRFDPEFIEMNPSRNLKCNLNKRKIIEHPTFYVILKDHIDAFVDEERVHEMDDVISNSYNYNSNNYNSNNCYKEAVIGMEGDSLNNQMISNTNKQAIHESGNHLLTEPSSRGSSKLPRIGVDKSNTLGFFDAEYSD